MLISAGTLVVLGCVVFLVGAVFGACVMIFCAAAKGRGNGG